MNVRYKREMRHNYLILEALEENPESYEIKMLAANSIEGILKFRIKQEEEHIYYYYEITSRQPLSRLLEFKEIKRAELSSLITGIGSILNRMEPYLLQEGNILLEPEHIYITPESFQVWLCYVPGYHGDFPVAMEKLLQFLLKKADHQDNDTVVLAYRLYQESQKDYYGIDDLLKAVQESLKERYPGSTGENLPENVQKDIRRNVRRNIQDSSFNSRNPENEKYRGYNRMEGWFQEEEDFPENHFRQEDIQSENDQDMMIPDFGKNTGKKQHKLKSKLKEKQRENRKHKNRKESKFAVYLMIIPALFLPWSIWFLAGEKGIRQYGGVIIAAEGIFLMVFLFLLLQKKKSTGGLNERLKCKFSNNREDGALKRKKTENEKESGRNPEREQEKNGYEKELPDSEWYMTFEEDGEDREEEEFESKFGVVREKGGKRWKDRAEDLENEDREGTACAGEQGKDTMLLAEMEPSAKNPHLLKSLDPSVEDIPVPYFPFIIGKQEGIVDYVLKKPTVSRLHIRIDQEEGKYKITDLNSSNGTIVAGQCLEANESCPVGSGDKIQIADLSFVFY